MIVGASPPRGRSHWLAFAAIVALALALRIAAGRGGLWTDEAWSAIYAGDAAPFLGVIAGINHDNNHHLNSWWLQLVGPHAPPLLVRALAIAASTAAVAIAGLIGFRRSAAAGLATALLFACAPVMVILGAEARGYALVMPLVLALVWQAERQIDRDGDRPASPALLAALAVAGALSHLLILPAIAAIALGVAWALQPALGWRESARRTIAVWMAPLIAASMVASLVMAFAALAGGMRVGGYMPFGWSYFFAAINDLLVGASGIGRLGSAAPWPVLAVAALVAAALAFGTRHREWRVHAALIALLPLAVALLQPGNTGFARYYLASAMGLLLLAGGAIGAARLPGWAKVAAVGGLAGLGLAANLDQIAMERNRPDRPVGIAQARWPEGASFGIASPMLEAPVRDAARRRGYPVETFTEAQAACARARYLLTAPLPAGRAPGHLVWCGSRFAQIAAARGATLSGNGWVLYAKQPLPTGTSVDNGPSPRR